MKLKVLRLDNEKENQEYNLILNSFMPNHPYYNLEFINTFSSGLKNKYAFIQYNNLEKPNILMPFHLRKINQNIHPNVEYYDVTSTYGYCGPLFNESLYESIIKQFWDNVDVWYKQKNIVSEFIRFSLNGNYLRYTGLLVPTLNNIKGKLLDSNLQWLNYNRKVRKNINKALREKLKVKIYHENISDKVISIFYDIYIETMDRTHASKEFYYSKQKIVNYINQNKKNSIIAITYSDLTPISTELILSSKHNIYSFLGGTKSKYFALRPNDFLKHEVINWGFKNGYEFFILGGGYDGDDGLFNYKKSFFPKDISIYYTGRKIINKQVYLELSTLNKEHNILNEEYFPSYRTSAKK